MIALHKYLNKRIVQFQEKFIRNPLVVGYPFHLVLETGNICNLKCPLCPTPWREAAIPKGMLDFKSAKKIIDQFPFLLHLNLSLWGEPLLNKEIFNIIRYAKSKIIVELDKDKLMIFNDGRHIDENQITNIFNAYEKTKDGNFGLGLSIVKKTAEMFGYHVFAENIDGGVKFCIDKR